MRWLYTPFLIIAVVTVFSVRTPSAFAATSPTRIGTDSAVYFASSDPWTMSVAVSGTGTNRALVCVIGIGGAGGAPTSVVYNGVETMTKIIDGTTFPAQQQTDGVMYYLASPTAATANVVATWGANKQGFFICATYQDMHQTAATVIDVSGAANSASATSLSKQVTTTLDGDVIINWVGLSSGASSHAPDGGQSLIGTVLESNIDAAASDIGQASAGAITTGWTWSNAASLDLFVVALKGVPSAGGSSIKARRTLWFF